jgi:hypothetical protein
MNREPTSLVTLSQLATEYGQKYGELHKISKDSPPNILLVQLEQRSEYATQHFRMAQQILLDNLSEQKDELQAAATTIFRSFDEMRILFQVLSERLSDLTIS